MLNKRKTGKNKNPQIFLPKLIWIYGKHPVLMALTHKRRKFKQIVITKNNQKQIQDFKLSGHLIKIADNKFISELLPEDVPHQGFALQASPIPTLNEEDFLSGIANYKQNELPPLLILDQLTDAGNVGAIIRSASAFGIKNIIITKHNFTQNNAVICKTSAGTIELVNVIIANNLNNLLGNLKKIGYWCIGLDGSAQNSIKQTKDYNNIALIIGNEGSGIRKLVKHNCDLLVKIPINKEVESLNAANAAAIALYELFTNSSDNIQQ